LLKENDVIRFPMDGTFETHSIYRKNSDLKIILQNLEKLKKYTKATVILQTIIFKYNEDQIDKIIEIFKQTSADLLELTHTGYSEYLDDKVRPVDELLKLYKKNDKISLKKNIPIKCESLDYKKIYLNCFGYFLPCENLDEYVFFNKDNKNNNLKFNLDNLFYKNEINLIINEINKIIERKNEFNECRQACGYFNYKIRKQFDVYQITKDNQKHRLKKYRLLYNE